MTEAAAAGKGSTGPGADGKTGDEGKTGASGTTETPEQKAAAEAAATAAATTAATAAQKVKDDKAAADAEAAKKSKEPPDKYELKIPDDATDWLDANDLKAIEGIAKKNKWTQEQAQGALEEHAETLVAQSKAFRAEIEADPTYGGDNLAETQRLATLAIDRIRPKDTDQGKALRSMLAKTGYGNNLMVVSLLADMGKMMDEDSTHLVAGAGKGKPKDPAEALYGKEATKT